MTVASILLDPVVIKSVVGGAITLYYVWFKW